MAAAPSPLVSILVPTYNRCSTLETALDSAIGQTHRPIEVVVSDNGSTDDTQATCTRYAEERAEIRYLRQPRNLGPTQNFELLRRAARGKYLVFLGDDDWFDAEYVARCLREFDAHPDCAIVAGRARYHPADGSPAYLDAPINLTSEDPVERIVDYYKVVLRNAVFYGLVRRSADRATPPLKNELGNDWLHVSALAFLGPVHTVEGVEIHRGVGSTSLVQVVQALRLGWFESTFPYAALVCRVFADVAFASPVYSSVGRRRRILAATAAVANLAARFSMLKRREIEGRYRAWRRGLDSDA
ncbi:MAG TPA: glycosyltransferase family 2 protein [Acidimicrobiales bacterium]|nr:glycosyltransferase family 2 protein [Acidimicrobiales bacterium]